MEYCDNPKGILLFSEEECRAAKILFGIVSRHSSDFDQRYLADRFTEYVDIAIAHDKSRPVFVAEVAARSLTTVSRIFREVPVISSDPNINETILSFRNIRL